MAASIGYRAPRAATPRRPSRTNPTRAGSALAAFSADASRWVAEDHHPVALQRCQLDTRLCAGSWRVAPTAIPQERHDLRVGRFPRLGVLAGMAHRLRTAHALSAPTLSPVSTWSTTPAARQ